MIQGREARLP